MNKKYKLFVLLCSFSKLQISISNQSKESIAITINNKFRIIYKPKNIESTDHQFNYSHGPHVHGFRDLEPRVPIPGRHGPGRSGTVQPRAVVLQSRFRLQIFQLKLQCDLAPSSAPCNLPSSVGNCSGNERNRVFGWGRFRRVGSPFSGQAGGQGSSSQPGGSEH